MIFNLQLGQQSLVRATSAGSKLKKAESLGLNFSGSETG